MSQQFERHHTNRPIEEELRHLSRQLDVQHKKIARLVQLVPGAPGGPSAVGMDPLGGPASVDEFFGEFHMPFFAVATPVHVVSSGGTGLALGAKIIAVRVP